MCTVTIKHQAYRQKITERAKSSSVIKKYRKLSVIALVKQLTIDIIDHAFVFDSDA